MYGTILLLTDIWSHPLESLNYNRMRCLFCPAIRIMPVPHPFFNEHLLNE